MLKSIKTKQEELLNTQKNAENNPKQNSTLAESIKLEGTPFYLIKQNETWFLIMGNHRITEPTKTKKETMDKLQKETWLIIMVMIGIVVDHLSKEPKPKKIIIDHTPKGQEWEDEHN